MRMITTEMNRGYTGMKCSIKAISCIEADHGYGNELDQLGFQLFNLNKYITMYALHKSPGKRLLPC